MGGKAGGGGGGGSGALLVLQKKITELELALAQCQKVRRSDIVVVVAALRGTKRTHSIFLP